MLNSTEYNALEAFIDNNIDRKKNYFFMLGYRIFGPLLYSYVKWLEENFSKNNYDNIFFLSRDGFIMKQAFEIINNTQNTNYLYASRRALTVPILWLTEDVDNLLTVMFFNPTITINAFLKKVGLQPQKYKDILNRYNYKLEQEINIFSEKKKQKFKDLYKELKSDINKNSKEEYENLINYLRINNFKGKVAIIDIGWFREYAECASKNYRYF